MVVGNCEDCSDPISAAWRQHVHQFNMAMGYESATSDDDDEDDDGEEAAAAEEEEEEEDDDDDDESDAATSSPENVEIDVEGWIYLDESGESPQQVEISHRDLLALVGRNT